MKKREKGILIFTLGFMSLVFVLAGALYVMIEGSRAQIIIHKQKCAAAYLASSGIEYSRHMITKGPWKEEKSIHFTSPALNRAGYFVIRADRPGGGAFRIKSTGYATDSITSEREETISP
jgi:hypothetical protein